MQLPLAQGLGKGPTTLGLLYAAFPYISVRGCFQDLNPWPHGHKAAALPLRQGSPSGYTLSTVDTYFLLDYLQKKMIWGEELKAWNQMLLIRKMTRTTPLKQGQPYVQRFKDCKCV